MHFLQKYKNSKQNIFRYSISFLNQEETCCVLSRILSRTYTQFEPNSIEYNETKESSYYHFLIKITFNINKHQIFYKFIQVMKFKTPARFLSYKKQLKTNAASYLNRKKIYILTHFGFGKCI